MCWSLGASAGFSVLGFALGIFWKNGGYARVGFFYWGIMELIQALQYIVIDDCENVWNKILTVAAFVHLWFQPVFYCFFLLHFANSSHQKDQIYFAMRISIILGCLLVTRLIDMDVDNEMTCDAYSQPMCGETLCAYSTSTHLAWQAPMRSCDAEYLTPGLSAHAFLWVAIPAGVGLWWVSVFTMLTGPFLSALFSDDKNGTGAIWCMYAVGQLLLVAIINQWRVKHVSAPLEGDTNPRRWWVESALIGIGFSLVLVCVRGEDFFLD